MNFFYIWHVWDHTSTNFYFSLSRSFACSFPVARVSIIIHMCVAEFKFGKTCSLSEKLAKCQHTQIRLNRELINICGRKTDFVMKCHTYFMQWHAVEIACKLYIWIMLALPSSIQRTQARWLARVQLWGAFRVVLFLPVLYSSSPQNIDRLFHCDTLSWDCIEAYESSNPAVDAQRNNRKPERTQNISI